MSELEAPRTDNDIWIFGYGSLMWNPGFPFVEAGPATVTGFHRSLCIYSVHHRGTKKHPGLVLGLDRGGQCQGIAFRICGTTWAETIDYLRKRELIYAVYRELRMPLTVHRKTQDGRIVHEDVEAITYVAERAHPAYAGDLSLSQKAQLIRRASGLGGTNLDYVLNTVAELSAMKITDAELERLVVMAGPYVQKQSAVAGHRSRAAALTDVCARKPVSCKTMRPDNRFGFRRKLVEIAGGGRCVTAGQ